MPARTIRDQVAAAWSAAARAPASLAGNARPVAIGWQTVELDHATAELADALGLAGGPLAFRAAQRSALLGAACRVAAGVLPDGGSLVALEPDTEGRLAGALARLGEGPALAWVAPENVDAALEALRASGFTVSERRDGPLGPERLITDGPSPVRPGPPDGRHLLLLERAAGTIRP